jgi:hypothetical protein
MYAAVFLPRLATELIAKSQFAHTAERLVFRAPTKAASLSWKRQWNLSLLPAVQYDKRIRAIRSRPASNNAGHPHLLASQVWTNDR